jgi:hypothetical protein
MPATCQGDGDKPNTIETRSDRISDAYSENSTSLIRWCILAGFGILAYPIDSPLIADI